MSAKAVREYHGKLLLAKWVKDITEGVHVMDDRAALVTPQTDYDVSFVLVRSSYFPSTCQVAY
jgi:hypothetical protein